MVSKYQLIEKDFYKKMFAEPKSRLPQICDSNTMEIDRQEQSLEGENFLIDEKNSLEKTKDIIIEKLK
jgi:hypothetical protein